MKIYVASSWRNPHQAEVVSLLRAAGHQVYDFKNPTPGDDGFRWRDVGLQRRDDGYCSPADLRQGLKHPRAVEGFASDFGAMQWADACVLLLPCGRSAHLEAGWMAGAGKLTLVLAPPDGAAIEPELMYGLTGQEICLTVDETVARLEAVELDAVDAQLRAAILSGDLEDAGIEGGERKYRLTEKGKARAEALYKEAGVDVKEPDALQKIGRWLDERE